MIKLKLIIVLLFSSLILANGPAEKHAFVGADKCGMCHKSDKQGKQLTIWQNSAHAKAYKTLQSDEANKIAKDKGFKTAAAETEACLKCHASGYEKDAQITGKFKVEDGVQCETCHGPGSDYQAMKVMKDPKLAVQNGLVMHDDKEKFCTQCHNKQSPTFKGFDYGKFWAKIQHPIPKS